MPDQKITATDEMVARARESLRSDGWTVGDGDTGLRAAITAALDAAPTTDEDARRPLTDTIDFAALWKQEHARAEKAEQERDEARAGRDAWKRMFDNLAEHHIRVVSEDGAS